jgi:hypothetical protein
MVTSARTTTTAPIHPCTYIKGDNISIKITTIHYLKILSLFYLLHSQHIIKHLDHTECHPHRADQNHQETVSQNGEERTYHCSREFDSLGSGPSRSKQCASSLVPTTLLWLAGSCSPSVSARGGPRFGPASPDRRVPRAEPQVKHRRGPLM